MSTIRATMNLDANLLDAATQAFPNVNRTVLVEEGLRALLAREAAIRLASAGGSAPEYKRAKRSAWRDE